MQKTNAAKPTAGKPVYCSSMRHLGHIVVATIFVFLATPGLAQTSAWRDHVLGAIRPGALVARRGLDTDPITQVVLWGQGGGRWSHVGIAVQLIPQGPVYIESAMPGAGTRLERPEVFFNVEQATDGAIVVMPADIADDVQSAAKALLGRPFDDRLDLEDQGQKLYCTELVAHALRQAGVLKDWPLRSVAFISQKVIAPDDLMDTVRSRVGTMAGLDSRSYFGSFTGPK